MRSMDVGVSLFWFIYLLYNSVLRLKRNAMAPASPRRQGTRSLQFSLQVQQPVSRTCCRQAAQVSANYVSRQRTAGNALVLTEP